MSNFPTITLQPVSYNLGVVGGQHTFTCAAESPDEREVLYQWGWREQYTGISYIVPGATSAAYTINPIRQGDFHGYYCFVRLHGQSVGIGTDFCYLGQLPQSPAEHLPVLIGGQPVPIGPPPTPITPPAPVGGSGTGTGTGGSTGTGGGPIGGGSTTGPTFDVGVDVASMAGWQGLARASKGWLRNGDFSARPCGPPIPELPFQEHGDRQTMIWRQRWRCALESWSAAPAYTTHPDRPEMYLIKETAFEVRGAGVLEWERWYCRVPQTHNEEEVFPFSYQYVASSTSLATFTRSVTSRIRCEYFLARDEGGFAALQKDEFYVLPTTTLNASAQGGGITLFKGGDIDLHLDGKSAFFVSGATDIVAEPSKITTWNFPIKCRATRYVPAPTMATLGTVVLSPVVPTT